MSVCTFFGHRDCPSSIKPKLYAVLIDLIENHSVDMFYVGNNGAFDRIVRSCLQELKQKYSTFSFFVVLEHIPGKNSEKNQKDCLNTILPEGIENAPPRFAILWRNKWMLHRADYVITYVTHSWGGAAQFAEMAKRRGKAVINISTQNGQS